MSVPAGRQVAFPFGDNVGRLMESSYHIKAFLLHVPKKKGLQPIRLVGKVIVAEIRNGLDTAILTEFIFDRVRTGVRRFA